MLVVLLRSAKAGEAGRDAEARRSGLTKTSSFDEAAAEAGRVLFRAAHQVWRAVRREIGQPVEASDGHASQVKGSQEGRDRERQRNGQRPSSGRQRRRKVRSSEGPRSRAYRSERRVSRAKARAIEGQTKARGSPSSEALPEVTSFVWFQASGRGSPCPRRKPKVEVIRESSGPESARNVSSVAEAGSKHLSRQGKANRKVSRATTGQPDAAVRPDKAGRFAAGERVQGEHERTIRSQVQACFGT